MKLSTLLHARAYRLACNRVISERLVGVALNVMKEKSSILILAARCTKGKCVVLVVVMVLVATLKEEL